MAVAGGTEWRSETSGWTGTGLPPGTTVLLEEWLKSPGSSLYPSKTQKEHLVSQSGLSYAQVARWFANRRRKVKAASSGGRSGSSGSLSSSATSPPISDPDWHLPNPLPITGKEEVGGDWMKPVEATEAPEGVPGSAQPTLFPINDPNLFYTIYMQQQLQLLEAYPWLAPAAHGLLPIPGALNDGHRGAHLSTSLPSSIPTSLPLSLAFPPPASAAPSDAALLMEEVLKATAKVAPPPSPPAALLLPSSNLPSPSAHSPSHPAWPALSEEESIAVSVLASFAQQKTAQAHA